MIIVRACHRCKKYIKIDPADLNNQRLIKIFENNHEGHTIGSVSLSEVMDTYEDVKENLMEKELSDSIVLKIITAGDGGAGKTTFLHRYTEGKFIADTKMTLGVGFSVKELNLRGITVMLQLWDFTGQEHLRFMLEKYSYGAKGALLMFDLNNIKRTLRNLNIWTTILNKNKEIPIILIGTKYDLIENNKKRYYMYNDYILKMRKKYNFIDYLETSSKTGYNVDKVFKILVNKILEQESS